MKKIKYLLLIAIISFFVVPSDFRASSPASLYQIVTLSGGVDGSIQTNEFIRGKSYNLITYSSGGYLYNAEYLPYKLDESIFEITNFFSDYGFKYNNGKIKLDGNKLLEEGFSTKYPTSLWMMQVKVKDNAKLGKTKIEDVSYEIVCDENEQCETNNDDKEEENNNLSNTPILDDTNNNDDKEEENNNLANTPILDDTNNNDDKEEENNNLTNTSILDDTKFYILSALLGVVVIEMFVLILKKVKK